MRVLRNVWFFVLVIVTAEVALLTSSNAVEKAIKSLETTMGNKFDKIIAAVNAISQGKSTVKPEVKLSAERNTVLLLSGSKETAYLLQMPSGKVPVYCHMSSHGLGACRGGGWTLIMKTDGNERTFHFNSKFWSSKVDFNLPGGKTLFDKHETKLPTYWNTQFSKICLGVKIGHQTRSIVFTKHANSLYSLIADGNYRTTSLGRNTWKSLLGSSASLQPNCNKEGFNIPGYNSDSHRARIGIIANEQNDCITPDSRISFGTGYGWVNDDSSPCGNQTKHGGDNGDKDIKAIGYTLVQ